MNAKEYISVVPILETKLDLLPLGEQRYAWFPSWDDLRSLNGKCLLDRFRVFVAYLALASCPTVLLSSHALPKMPSNQLLQ